MQNTKSLRSNRYDPVTIEQLSSKELKTIETIGKEERKHLNIDTAAVDRALELTADIRNHEHPRTGQPMRPFYAHKIKQIGVARYLGIASEARQNYRTTPKQYFAYLCQVTV